MIELFACRPLSVRLTRQACADRHRAAKRQTGGIRKAGEQYLIGHATCAECALGAAHARGDAPLEWPDEVLVELSGFGPGTSRLTGAPPPPRSEQRPDVQAGPQPPPPSKGRRGAARKAETLPRSEEPSDTTNINNNPSRTPPVPEGSSARGETAAKEARVGSKDHGEIVEEQRGARTFRRLRWNGKTLSAGAWANEPECKAIGLTKNAIDMRVRAGMSVREALTTPNGAGTWKKPPKKGAKPKTPSAPKADPVLEDLDRRFEPEPTVTAVTSSPEASAVRDFIAMRIAQSERELAAMRAALAAYDEARGA